jgi:Icc-related predicted phosphoesterase
MEFIATMLGVPCYFVHGNHDHVEYTARGLVLEEPGGWSNIDGRVVLAKGLLIGGLEGSIRYRPGAPYQYSETEMMAKIFSMAPSLLLSRLVHGRYLDILVTHAPAFGILDGEDRAHRGFKAFLWFIQHFHPRLLLHGHKHLYGLEERRARYVDTDIVNVYPYQVIELDQ